MKVTINHRQKTTGMIRKITHHGVDVRVQFNSEELAVIQERQLERDIILERGYSSEVSVRQMEKDANRGVGKKLLKAAVSGFDSMSTNLTVQKLLNGGDVFYFTTPVEAKEYEAALKEGLVRLKGWIEGNKEVETETGSFEL